MPTKESLLEEIINAVSKLNGGSFSENWSGYIKSPMEGYKIYYYTKLGDFSIAFGINRNYHGGNDYYQISVHEGKECIQTFIGGTEVECLCKLVFDKVNKYKEKTTQDSLNKLSNLLES